MKRLLAILLLAVAVVTTVSAQTHYVPHIWVGVHGGATLSNVSFSPSVRQTFADGVTAGVSFRYAEERHVGVLGELNITQRGWKEDFEEASFEYTRNLTYISLPVMTHIFFGSKKAKCFINLGPEIGYMIGDKISANFDYHNPLAVEGFPAHNRMYEQMSLDIKNRFDYGITAGLGGEFRIRRNHAVYLEARYYFGLGNIYPSSKKDIFGASRNSTIQITLGYHYRLK